MQTPSFHFIYRQFSPIIVAPLAARHGEMQSYMMYSNPRVHSELKKRQIEGTMLLQRTDRAAGGRWTPGMKRPWNALPPPESQIRIWHNPFTRHSMISRTRDVQENSIKYCSMIMFEQLLEVVETAEYATHLINTHDPEYPWNSINPGLGTKTQSADRKARKMLLSVPIL